MFNIRRKLSGWFFALGCAAGAAQASPYSDLFVFGDSLTDTGNVLALTTAFAPPAFPNFPGAAGRFSNGPVWIEHLANGLGLPSGAVPSRLLPIQNPADPTKLLPVAIGAPGGNNFAYGGARTGLGGSAGATTGLLGQLISWNGVSYGAGDSLTRSADPNALYVILAGANDLRDIRSANFGSTPADVAARAGAAAGIAFNVVNAVGALAQQGARHFLLANLPDLGSTPEAVILDSAAPGLRTASTDVTTAFNAALNASLQQLDALFNGSFNVDLDLRLFDLYDLMQDILDDAINHGGAAFGITNVATPCINPVAPGAYYFPGSTDINCSVSLFSDPLHPSARAHQLLAATALQVALPLPGSAALVLLAGAMLFVARRRRA